MSNGTAILKKLGRIPQVLFNKDERFVVLSHHGFCRDIPDEEYLKRLFRIRLGYELNLENPRTFNEKLQWLKLYDRKPLYTELVDKAAAKEYVAARLGEECIIPTYGVWDSFEEIDFSKLPDRFVLKCTHDSGGVVICTDKSKFDCAKARKVLNKGLKTDFYLLAREWPYKNVKRRIIAEKYIGDSSEASMLDYKLMCFNGQVKCSFTCTNRNSTGGLNVTFFDNDWNKLPIERHYPADPTEIKKPETFEQMKQMAQVLAQCAPFMRVDFYEVDGKVYFGEMTLYPGAGFEEFSDMKYDIQLGDLIQLPK